MGGVVVAIAGEITDLDLGIGQRFLDQAFEFAGFHGHLGGSSGWPAAHAIGSRRLTAFPLDIAIRGRV